MGAIFNPDILVILMIGALPLYLTPNFYFIKSFSVWDTVRTSPLKPTCQKRLNSVVMSYLFNPEEIAKMTARSAAGQWPDAHHIEKHRMIQAVAQRRDNTPISTCNLFRSNRKRVAGESQNLFWLLGLNFNKHWTRAFHNTNDNCQEPLRCVLYQSSGRIFTSLDRLFHSDTNFVGRTKALAQRKIRKS